MCWCIIFGIYVVESVWLALSAAYPMAFDEQFHFGLIRLHARQLLPFFTSQPPTGVYGAVVRDPSYLYHWLMSLPYRAILLFTHDQTIQIIVLRLINVALFAIGLILYRRLMRRMGLSPAFTHSSLLLFILVPVVPFLAATINYDNLIVVIVPWAALLSLDVTEAFRKHQILLARLMGLLSVLLLGSLVKYAFLPVLVVTCLFLLALMWRYRLLTATVWWAALKEVRAMYWIRQVLLVVLLLISIGLFSERYVINLVRYHTPVPTCGQVISQSLCSQYGPSARDYAYESVKPAAFRPNIIMYTGSWLHGMWYRLFFAINYTYENYPPLFIISRIAIGTAVLLGLGVVFRSRWIFRGHPERLLLLLLIFGYGFALYFDNYTEYTQTAEAVAINGRYWIPFLPFIFVLGGFAWSDILRRTPGVKTGVATVVLAAFLLQGGGAVTYIVRSNDNWYWPNKTVRRLNGDIRTVVSPLIYGKNLPT
jgi:hypothetical protein